MGAKVVLQSWKEISAYVGRTERTLQRWEQQFGFPIHRPSSKLRSSVMALSEEIQDWTRAKPSLLSIRQPPIESQCDAFADSSQRNFGRRRTRRPPARCFCASSRNVIT